MTTELRGVCGEVDEDAIRVLAEPRRRQILSVLRDAEGARSVSDLAAEVADRVGRKPEIAVEGHGRDDVRPWDATDPREVRRSAISMHHVDLPALEEVGLVEYDAGTKMVTATERTTGPSRVADILTA